MTVGSFLFNGSTFFYEIEGQGEPIVFIHAGICDRRMWGPQMAFFKQSYRAISYDMRGFGETAVSDTTYSHLDDLKALFDHWQLDSAHIVGCSRGGMLAMDFTLAFPQKAKSLTMVCSNPSGFNFEGEPPPQWGELVAAADAGDVEKTVELEIQFWVDGWQHRPPGAAPEHVRELVREMNTIVMKNDMMDIGEERPLDTTGVEQIDTLNLPIFLIDGKYDDDDLGKALDFIQAHHPSAQKIVLDSGHIPSLETPDALNEALNTFLQSHSA
ncbi:MAG: alpha/beta hydrolase [Chloroflexota bacterium]